MENQQQTSWWDRNWKWFVPTGCVTLIVLFILFFGGIFYGVSSLMKNATPTKEAFQLASTNTEVIDVIGEPIKQGFMFTGNISTSGSTGNADIVMPIEGSKGEGEIYIIAEKKLGKWEYSTLLFKDKNSEKEVDLSKSLQ